MLPWGRLIEIPMGWGSSSGTQVSGSAPAGGVGYANLQTQKKSELVQVWMQVCAP